MSISNWKIAAKTVLPIAFGLAGALSSFAQDGPLPAGSVNIDFPGDSPLALLKSADESHASARGAALAIDLHLALTLRNIGPNRIRGLVLRVISQEAALGGKGSVSLTSLNIPTGESFPVHIDMQLMRPSQSAAGPLVEVTLDGVLFQNLAFYGPNRLGSQRALTAAEMEAGRDRQYFKGVLARGGPEALRREVLDSLTRQAARPQLDVRVSRGHAVTSAALGPEHTEQFAFLEFPDSPVEAVEGRAQVAFNQARQPRIQVRNRSTEPVRYVEVRWLVRDSTGHEYVAAKLPVSVPEGIAPGQTAGDTEETSLEFRRNNRPVEIRGAVGFVSQVQFSNGRVWVPARRDLDSGTLLDVLPPSAEEERLTNLYRRNGLDALLQELKKY
ncbi:MAG: hypothetical protein ACLPX8_01515 [Bryobacteraceae bacterium]|jgi:hypothetical protein